MPRWPPRTSYAPPTRPTRRSRAAAACSSARPAPSSWSASWSRLRRPTRPIRSARASSRSSAPPRLEGCMCGIVGYVGDRAAQEILLAGLRKLEYRGYDSAGISVLADGEIESIRAVGNLDNLDAAVERAAQTNGNVAVATRAGTTGIAHTRWATHGRVNEINAHPHLDASHKVHVVVNGIVENYMALKSRLIDMGAVFTSETDAEVIAHLIAHDPPLGTLRRDVRRAYNELEGHFAFVAMSLDQPDTLVGARRECPMVVGRGEGETFLASAVPAFLAHTRRVQWIENGEIIEITPESVVIVKPDGTEVERPIEE